MERLITFWHGLTTEQLVISLLICAVIYLNIRIGRLSYKYTQLDKLILVHAYIIHYELGIKTVEVHRNGDYEITNPVNGG